jgi:hypothetical protein
MDTEITKSTNWSKRTKLALAAAAFVGVGAVGAFAVGATRPSVEMAPLNPVAIRTLAASTSIVTVKGQVADVYGNKFVLADASGKTLVDTGRAGEYAALVTSGQPVTVQGRFRHGFVQASFLIGADGKVVSLRPMGGPRDHDGPGRDDRGPRGDHGPRGEGPPPPPPAGDDDANPVAAPAAAPATAAPAVAKP